MDFFARLEQFARLDQLIRLKATGTPKQLAEKIGMSRRQLLRDISLLKEKGFPIQYCKHKQCYYYTETVKMNFEVIVGLDKLMAIKGGQGIISLNTDAENSSNPVPGLHPFTL